MVRGFPYLLLLFLMGCGGRKVNDHVPMDGERVRVLKSQKDLQNRYPFAVRVSADTGLCSGVLVSAQLVLTAAHCVCNERQGEDSNTLMDASDCVATARVDTVLYGSAGVEEDPGTEEKYEGQVRVNKRFKLVEGVDERVRSIQADLALVRLDRKVVTIRAVNWMGRPAVNKEEFLFMVGYGYFEKDSKRLGERRFGPNAVTAVDGEKFQFRKPGSHMMDSDSGGPCIRETAKGPELVGIMISGAAPDVESSTCMNTYSRPVQDWLRQELKSAGDAL